MKRLLKRTYCIYLLLILLMQVLGSKTTLAQQHLVIYVNTNDSKVKELASELQNFLSQASQKTVAINNTNGNIQLIIEQVAPKLKKEGFQIANEENKLIIRANHLNGLRNGVYYYLNKLGFRFFLPGDIWMHIPKLASVFISLNESKYPLFENRSVFGTGGFPYNPVMDPGKKVQKKWEQWFQRTSWSADEYIGGHIGESFNNKYKSVLEDDKSLLALYNGKREWRTSAKWCISNQKFMDLFIRDRLKAFEKQKLKTPDRNLISVEPADGGGNCQCDNCQKMGTISDRVFYLANQVARAIKQKWPDGGVSLYAYNDHALPPEKHVDANVYVAVIPYAFQNVAVPEILLSEWRKKCDQLGIYDYWNLTDGSKDLPNFNYLVYLPQKLKFWESLKIKGYSLESGYSKFAAGIPLYFLSRITWDSSQNVEDLLDEFCQINFAKASGIIKGMLTRWAKDFNAEKEFWPSLSEIRQAKKMVTDSSAIERLAELEHYIYYTAFYTDAVDHFATKEAVDKIENCIRFIWTVYDEGLINTSRIHQFFLLRPVREQQKALVSKWSLSNTSAQKPLWLQFLNKSPENVIKEAVTISFANSNELQSNTVTEDDLDKTFNQLHLTFNSANELHIKTSKAIYFSFNTGSENSLVVKIQIPQKTTGIPGLTLYDIDKTFIRYYLLNNIPGAFQEIRIKDLEKKKRYRILINIPGMVWELKIPNKAVVIDAQNIYNKYISLQSKQETCLLLNGRLELKDLDTKGFKGIIYAQNRKIIKDVSNSSSRDFNMANDTKYIIVKQRGNNSLALKIKVTPSLYFFK
jgi:hypothetical protein